MTRPPVPLMSARAWRIALVLLVLVVTWLAVVPMPPRALTTGWDKLNHASAFGALALTARLAFPLGRIAAWRIVIALIAYGGLIEIVQLFVPGRDSDWADLLADSIGVGIGLLVATGLLALWRRRAEP